MFNLVQAAITSAYNNAKTKLLSPAHQAFIKAVEPGLLNFVNKIDWKKAFEDAAIVLITKYSKTSPADAKAAYEQVEPVVEKELPILLSEAEGVYKAVEGK